MTEAAQATMKEDLAFLSKMVQANPELPKEWIYKNYLLHQEVDSMSNYINQFMPLLEPIIGDLAGQMKGFMATVFKSQPKNYHEITIQPEKPIEVPEIWDKGDKATLVLGEDIFIAEIETYFDEEECYYGVIIDELKDTKHGAKKGDVVRFKNEHIFKYESIS